MPQLDVDAMNDAASWRPLAPDGVTPSSELTVALESATVRFGADARSLRITTSRAATGHLLRRTLPAALDLRPFDELRLSLWSSRVTHGTGGPLPFFLELRLGSDAVGPDAPSNTWHRLLPVSTRSTWEPVRLGLSDLDPAVRSAVRVLQLRCVEASSPFTCFLDDVIAVREEMIGDVEAALAARLDGKLRLGDTAVPAVVNAPGVPVSATPPYLLITQYEIAWSDARTPATRGRGDFSTGGSVLRPPSFGWDLHYQLQAFANDRPSQARMLEFLLRALGPHGELVVNGWPLPYALVSPPADERLGGQRTERVALHYRIAARLEVGASEPTHSAREPIIEADLRSA
ncbi:hypothetical protein [Myxococcus sp. RHSTA-1-4]|uniref:hypothetical protein n=1 Tax=Myxococcus sp. RHSTA-1-4 TaxID=2874601 RepID=UPI001CBBCF64|nr:hypothetical protein [Myxococcus sp. RHSTA-1-4]MBZ4417442.1 hypothetical protein [Myxococcus sp. RHSTA-1-4]